MSTTKQRVASDEQPSTATVNLRSIVLAHVRSDRNFDPRPDDDTGNATMEMNVETVEGSPMARTTTCSVEFKDSNDGVIVSIESKFRARFKVEGPSDDASLEDHMSGLALRITYPYHRQIISSLVAQSGLPGVVLPLIGDNDLDDMAKSSVAVDEADGD